MPSTQQPYAEIADLTIDIAREIRLRGHATLNQTESQVMRHLHQHPGSTPSHIAAGTGLIRANVSPALRRLRSLGYVSSDTDPNDARSVRVTPTALAQDTLDSLRASWSESVQEAWPADIDPSETVVALQRLLHGLIRTRNAP
ncbi:MarR family winged helix-turn-helix transcriptional regulator [Leucobacter rhizosphaerae]|uniref:MarR family winged helix-turn-helix transcriptional regulator n=1 Tax=Leucobacter rhizosphaerae TaxID=2932245 RepID=A0ABY4FU66_9MICO|nr:MarR family winged helix-turn-helix transcriptional regulator [Leucobacter rhizosphaerae]UOQ59699.1 MarR family winged helix-turn-helix transcriptional regulator [Leucobacter rhizosphaerae]